MAQSKNDDPAPKSEHILTGLLFGLLGLFGVVFFDSWSARGLAATLIALGVLQIFKYYFSPSNRRPFGSNE